MLKNITVLFADISTIWGNKNGCADQFHCATALYLISIFAHTYNIIIDHVVGAPGHGREVAGGFNATEKRVLSNFNENCATAWCSSL